jgi:glycosyltransferase involved in cell wall biosynthesis
MPAYNTAQTPRKIYDEVMAQEIVDQVIVVDDKSDDETVSIANRGLTLVENSLLSWNNPIKAILCRS